MGSEVSVVLISKNQEWNIERLIKSVLEETAYLPLGRIILVDSASTDRTTEVAAQFPITIIKLNPEQRLTAAAGRYVGYQHTTGDFILFLDGDMELYPGWLDLALEVMKQRTDAGVLCGVVMDRPIDLLTTGKQRGEVYPVDKLEVEKVLQSGGASLFRRSILEKVAVFNPYLFSEEEPGLCLRIRFAGYQIYRLNFPIVFHYTVEREILSSLFDKRKNNFWLGFGQNLRYFKGSGLFWQYIKERGWFVAPAILGALGIILLLISVFSGSWIWFSVWVLIFLVILISLAIRKRSLKKALLILLRRFLILEGTVRGFFLEPVDPVKYSIKFDMLQK